MNNPRKYTDIPSTEYQLQFESIIAKRFKKGANLYNVLVAEQYLWEWIDLVEKYSSVLEVLKIVHHSEDGAYALYLSTDYNFNSAQCRLQSNTFRLLWFRRLKNFVHVAKNIVSSHSLGMANK